MRNRRGGIRAASGIDSTSSGKASQPARGSETESEAAAAAALSVERRRREAARRERRHLETRAANFSLNDRNTHTTATVHYRAATATSNQPRKQYLQSSLQPTDTRKSVKHQKKVLPRRRILKKQQLEQRIHLLNTTRNSLTHVVVGGRELSAAAANHSRRPSSIINPLARRLNDS